MQQEKSCGAVVFTRIDNKIQYVIVQQLEGFHGFPKGHMENGETEQQTALREIQEEVGLKPQIMDGFRSLDEYIISHKPDTMKQVVYFLAEYTNQPIVVQKEELLEATLCSFEEAYKTLEYSGSKRILKEANDFLTYNFNLFDSQFIKQDKSHTI
mgnify:CR=1 FL=1